MLRSMKSLPIVAAGSNDADSHRCIGNCTARLSDEDRKFSEAVVHALAKEEGRVPALFWFEVWNTLAMSERKGRSSPENSKRFLDVLTRLSLSVDPLPDSEKVLALSRSHQITTYDAAYLELALRFESPLATKDHTLASAAINAGGTLF